MAAASFLALMHVGIAMDVMVDEAVLTGETDVDCINFVFVCHLNTMQFFRVLRRNSVELVKQPAPMLCFFAGWFELWKAVRLV